MNKQLMASALALATTLSPSLLVQVGAQSPADPDIFDLKAVSCRELLLAGADNRELMMSLFHGFINGRKNETQLNPNQLAEATDKIENYCVDNPKAKLLEVFEKYRDAER